MGRGAAAGEVAGRGFTAMQSVFDCKFGDRNSSLNPYLPFPWEGIALARCFKNLSNTPNYKSGLTKQVIDEAVINTFKKMAPIF